MGGELRSSDVPSDREELLAGEPVLPERLRARLPRCADRREGQQRTIKWRILLARQLFWDPGIGDVPVIEPFAFSFPPDPALLFGFRASLREWLGSTCLAPDARNAVVLAVHEAVANGIEHGMSGEPVLVAARVEDGDVIVEITSAGSWEEPIGASRDLRGRGLQLMRGLTTGFEIVPDGEFVTVRLRSVS